MVTIEMSDITQLLGNIHLPSFDIKDPIDTTYYQQIIYLGLFDQCQKCRRFTHFVNACQIQRVPLYEGPNPNASQLPTWNEMARYGSGSIPNHNGAKTPVT
jgi:hypothetical protein